MATLSELLDLLPDNAIGAIDAVDLRTIVTELWAKAAVAPAYVVTGAEERPDATLVMWIDPREGSPAAPANINLSTDLWLKQPAP
jgi:hypothetical protein